MSVETSKPKSILKIIIWTLLGLSLAASGFAVYLYLPRDTNPIPTSLRSQLTFSPFVLPKGTKQYTTTDYKFLTAEDNVRTLSYVIHTTSGTISVKEQSQPLEFTEIADYKDRFLNNMKQYDTIQTSNGIIYLGRLALQNNEQMGIMIEKGLLVFMIPNKEMATPQWRVLGDQLQIQTMTN